MRLPHIGHAQLGAGFTLSQAVCAPKSNGTLVIEETLISVTSLLDLAGLLPGHFFFAQTGLSVDAFCADLVAPGLQKFPICIVST